MPFPQRILGRDGPNVSAVGLGFGSFTGFYGPPGTTEERIKRLDHAHSIGSRFWDLADIYGDSEDLVGEWIKRSGKRSDIFLATKCGLQRQPNGMHTFCSDPEYVKEACDRSLKRLGVDTIDLYYCHRVDGVTPIEKTIEAMVELKNQGKIRYIGVSDVSAATLRRAHAVHPIAALQIEYSLFTFDIESSTSKVLETARELGITVVAFSPIGRGILTGQFRSRADFPQGDLRTMYPKYAEENFLEIIKLVEGVEEVAHDHECTPAQVALAWLLAQGPEIIPIPGTNWPAKMDENSASALVELSDGEIQRLRTLAEKADIQGTRYPSAVMDTLHTDTPLP